jgi:hypothetical protein
MHESFASYVDTLHPSFEKLIGMTPLKIEDLRKPLPDKCVYLFSEKGRALYVGRTNHFRQRVRQHSIDAAQHNQAVFAFRLARTQTGKIVASYSKTGSRTALLADPQFAEAFLLAKARIRNMELRYVEEKQVLRRVWQPAVQSLSEVRRGKCVLIGVLRGLRHRAPGQAASAATSAPLVDARGRRALELRQRTYRASTARPDHVPAAAAIYGPRITTR